ncbi:hypothetical protein PG996_007585 [Apiospora saccharicola]|uniref:Uncharacterized protein n=1 Tax=Apiospora saccharicola TaxID=335842 RepID=A0ABR1VB91_9PEZI
MQFFQLAVAALASASAVYAMPAPGTDTKAAAEKRSGPDVGECNGTSCYIYFQNIACTQGTSTKQSGAGDGTPCNVYNFGDGQAYAICPGHGG